MSLAREKRGVRVLGEGDHGSNNSSAKGGQPDIIREEKSGLF